MTATRVRAINVGSIGAARIRITITYAVVGDHAKIDATAPVDSEALDRLAGVITGLRDQVGALCAQVDALCGLRPVEAAVSGGDRVRART
jgi:hypothetical protein